MAICECGQEFIQRRTDHRYCSELCRDRYKKRRQNEHDDINALRMREGMRPKNPKMVKCLGVDCDREFLSEDPTNIRKCPVCRLKNDDVLDPSFYGFEREWNRVEPVMDPESHRRQVTRPSQVRRNGGF